MKMSSKESMRAGALIGIGFMAAIDEIVFYQVLAWHHFYDMASTKISLMSDGFLHAVEIIAWIAGFFLLLDLRRNKRNTNQERNTSYHR